MGIRPTQARGADVARALAAIWLMIGGGLVVWIFFVWENRLLKRGGEPLDRPLDPPEPHTPWRTHRVLLPVLRAGRIVLCGAAVPLSGAWGCPRSIRAFACCRSRSRCRRPLRASPRSGPNASPQRVVRIGFLLLFTGLVVMVGALDAGAGAEIVTWPMLLAGLGIGALASQLGSVTVSSVPDEQSGEVGGLQNTVTNLGASIGTALQRRGPDRRAHHVTDRRYSEQPAVAEHVEIPGADRACQRRPVPIGQGPPAALEQADVPKPTADEIVKENAMPGSTRCAPRSRSSR